MTTVTMADKGNAYVAKWPSGIARQLRISPEYIADAMVRADIINESERHRLGMAFLAKEFTPEVAALTPDAAKTVVEIARSIRLDLNAATLVSCHYCGLDLNTDGECRECGDQPPLI